MTEVIQPVVTMFSWLAFFIVVGGIVSIISMKKGSKKKDATFYGGIVSFALFAGYLLITNT